MEFNTIKGISEIISRLFVECGKLDFMCFIQPIWFTAGLSSNVVSSSHHQLINDRNMEGHTKVAYEERHEVVIDCKASAFVRRLLSKIELLLLSKIELRKDDIVSDQICNIVLVAFLRSNIH